MSMSIYRSFDPGPGPRPGGKGFTGEVKVSARKPSVSTTRKAGRPSPGQVQDISNNIIDASLNLFLHRGYEVTTIDEIVSCLGISKGTFYSRYANKAEVFEVAIARLVDRSFKLKEEGSGSSLFDRLYNLTVQLLQIVLSEDVAALERLMLAEAKRFPHLASVVYDVATRRAISFYQIILAEALQNGELRDLNVANAAEDLLNVLIMAPLRRRALGLEDGNLNAVQLQRARYSIDLLMRGCCKA